MLPIGALIWLALIWLMWAQIAWPPSNHLKSSPVSQKDDCFAPLTCARHTVKILAPPSKTPTFLAILAGIRSFPGVRSVMRRQTGWTCENLKDKWGKAVQIFSQKENLNNLPTENLSAKFTAFHFCRQEVVGGYRLRSARRRLPCRRLRTGTSLSCRRPRWTLCRRSRPFWGRFRPSDREWPPSSGPSPGWASASVWWTDAWGAPPRAAAGAASSNSGRGSDACTRDTRTAALLCQDNQDLFVAWICTSPLRTPTERKAGHFSQEKIAASHWDERTRWCDAVRKNFSAQQKAQEQTQTWTKWTQRRLVFCIHCMRNVPALNWKKRWHVTSRVKTPKEDIKNSDLCEWVCVVSSVVQSGILFRIRRTCKAFLLEPMETQIHWFTFFVWRTILNCCLATKRTKRPTVDYFMSVSQTESFQTLEQLPTERLTRVRPHVNNHAVGSRQHLVADRTLFGEILLLSSSSSSPVRKGVNFTGQLQQPSVSCCSPATATQR